MLSADEIHADQWAQEDDTITRWQFAESSVLVVDDGEENRDLLQVVLSDAGIQVFTAENGQEALGFLAHKMVDVVLMDVQMPVMDGLTAAGIMRRSYSRLPVIALTADAMSGAQQQCLDAGYSDYLTKPVDIDQLMGRLAELLQGQKVAVDLSADEHLQRESADGEVVRGDTIVTSLDVSNPRFRSIVGKFIERMHEQMGAIELAWQQRDYDQLKKLGHWLKGSSGTVGFNQLVEPGRQLEQYAQDKDDNQLGQHIEQLKAMVQRLAIEDQTQSDKVEKIVQPVKDYDIPELVACRLPATNPRIRNVIDEFLQQLADKLVKIDADVAGQDYDRIVKFAYWLKASGGSVGFDAFTEPAKDLEKQAREQQIDDIRHTLRVIKTLSSRIDLNAA